MASSNIWDGENCPTPIHNILCAEFTDIKPWESIQFDSPVWTGVWHPPFPNTDAEPTYHEQVPTPPSTPPPNLVVRTTPQVIKNPRDLSYFGYMAPLNKDAVNSLGSWYFLRLKSVYRMGCRQDMDIIMSSSCSNHHCTIQWDGTDNEDAVTITEHVSVDKWQGTYVNSIRLRPEVPSPLRHGDYITIMGPDHMDPYEDYRFMWIQCTQLGWLPAQIIQNAWSSGMSDDD